MSTETEAVDALMSEGGGGTPWAKFPALNAVVRGPILSITKRQRLEFKTNKPLTNKDGSPAEEIVIVVQTDERDPEIEDDDGRRAFHAPIWYFDGCMRVAIMNAVTAAGVKAPVVGGELAVQHVGMDGEAKTYVAKYTPPAVTDLMAETTPAPAAPAAEAPASIL